MKTIISLLNLLFLLSFTNNLSYSQTLEPYDIFKNFIASGYMGDIKNIIVVKNFHDNSRSDSLCIKISYHKVGDSGWAGVYWQYPANNWCQKKGKDLSNYGFSKVTFWVKGERGGEEVKFKVGQDCGDSFVSDEITQYLTKEWVKVSIEVQSTSLTNITGAFCWVVDSKANEIPVVLYLDDVQFE